MICFLLQGATTADAPTTLMAYMLSDFYRPGVALDFPQGGTASIIDALRGAGVTKHPRNAMLLRTHVDGLVFDAAGSKVEGVRLRGGRQLHARRAVISNADLWSTRKMVNATSGGACRGAR